MAAVILREGHAFDSGVVFKHVENLLPSYARPLFIRAFGCYRHFQTSEGKLTQEGFHPHKISDPLYFYHTRQNDYVPLTLNIYNCVVTGTIKL
uniref:Uncharacterized protein n=1 Tax=Neogobius melanostomus TaxID=47308 RepID=A0A8C6U421_9GOBI